MNSEIMGIIIMKLPSFVVMAMSLYFIRLSEKKGKKPSLLAAMGFALGFCTLPL
jgi:hypothetical protein